MRRKRRGVWKRIGRAQIRFELHRTQGLKVRRRRHADRVVSFTDLLDLAEGQIKMNLL